MRERQGYAEVLALLLVLAGSYLLCWLLLDVPVEWRVPMALTPTALLAFWFERRLP